MPEASMVEPFHDRPSTRNSSSMSTLSLLAVPSVPTQRFTPLPAGVRNQEYRTRAKVALDVQSNTCSCVTQDLHVTVRYIDTMGSEQSRRILEVSLVSIVRDWRCSMRCGEVFDFFARLVKVKLHDDAKIAGSLKVLPNEGRRRVMVHAPETGLDPSISFVVPAYDELFGLFQLAPLVLQRGSAGERLARTPASPTARATSSSKKYISANIVVPDIIPSASASKVP